MARHRCGQARSSGDFPPSPQPACALQLPFTTETSTVPLIGEDAADHFPDERVHTSFAYCTRSTFRFFADATAHAASTFGSNRLLDVIRSVRPSPECEYCGAAPAPFALNCFTSAWPRVEARGVRPFEAGASAASFGSLYW